MIYKATKKYEKALDYHERYKLLSDSIFDKESIEKITALEYEYKYEKELSNAADREIKLTQTVQSKTQDIDNLHRNFLIGIIVFLASAVILVSIIFYLKLRHANAKNNY